MAALHARVDGRGQLGVAVVPQDLAVGPADDSPPSGRASMSRAEGLIVVMRSGGVEGDDPGGDRVEEGLDVLLAGLLLGRLLGQASPGRS